VLRIIRSIYEITVKLHEIAGIFNTSFCHPQRLKGVKDLKNTVWDSFVADNELRLRGHLLQHRVLQ
jgi:hypothetical protein